MNKNSVSLTFAGQAGFIFESDGIKIGIDLYLSDCCERFFGFKRLMPYVFEPSELDLDLLVATHAHYDHFDIDSIQQILENEKTKLVCACDIKAEADNLGLDSDKITYLKVGDVFVHGSVKIKAVSCDHGELAPDALGLLIEMGGKRIYIAGDTAYREDYFGALQFSGLDLLILPINGAFGNLNETEAADAAQIINPALTVPCHYWNFAEHGGNPMIFADAMNKKGISYVLMRIGEMISI